MFGVRYLEAAQDPSCFQLAAGARIPESSSFTPYAARLTQLLETPIKSSAKASIDVPTAAVVSGGLIDALPIQHVVTTASGAVYQYFLDRPLGTGMTPSDFAAAGGIQYQRDPIEQSAPFARDLLAQLKERAVLVRVRGYDATLTWADPLENGIRTHNLYWSDGFYNYALIANRPAEALVNLGRSLGRSPGCPG